MVKTTMDSFEGVDGGGLSLAQAVDVYERLSPHKKQLDAHGLDLLKHAIAVLSPAQQFVVLSQDEEFSGIHRRLFDAVHAPKNQDELIERLGDLGTNKVAMAMAIQDENGEWFPTAVVYTYWSDRAALPEKIMPILSEPLRLLNGPAQVIVPYTISSNFPKAGEMLIGNVHEFVYSQAPEAVLSTLSPLRAGQVGYATWLRERELHAANGHSADHVFDYLMPAQGNSGLYQAQDPVQGFHMAGMGAMLAGIRPGNHDSPQDEELAHGVMANYVYPDDPHILEDNRRRFVEEGVVTVSPEVAALIPADYHSRIYVQPLELVGRDAVFNPDGLNL